MSNLPAQPSGFNALSPQQQREHRAKIGGDAIVDVFHLDHVTGRLTWQVGRRKGREAFTAISKDGYRVGLYKRRQYFAHRVIWALVNGEWPQQVDHVNGNRLDNRPENLRAASHTQNMRNKQNAGGKSRYRGVNPSGRKWTAAIGIGGKKRHLGSFETEVEAARAYDLSAIEADPVFARTNFGGCNE